MKRREFAIAGAAGTAAVAGLAGMGLQANAQQAPAQAVAGKDYMVLKKPASTDAPKGKAEIVEFFGYWCPHCHSFEPEFNAWLKQVPPQVVVRRVPVAFRPEMAPLQRMFYALETLGYVGLMHGRVFDAIHKQRINLMTDANILAWAAQQPELKGRFEQAYKSFGMDAKLRRANQLAMDYGIEGVPSLGVAGKFYIDGETAKGLTRGLQIATTLALQAAKG